MPNRARGRYLGPVICSHGAHTGRPKIARIAVLGALAMDKTQTILGVLTVLYGLYIAVAVWRSRAASGEARGKFQHTPREPSLVLGASHQRRCYEHGNIERVGIARIRLVQDEPIQQAGVVMRDRAR